MKYAIISDIHGNLPALSAVLKDLEAAGVEKYIFAGDYYMCLPFPNEVIELIKNFTNAYIIKGNEEDYLLNLAEQDQRTWTDGQFCALYWCFKTITEENRAFLSPLPEKLAVSDGGVGINIAHSPVEFIGEGILKEFSSERIAEKYGISFSREALLNDISEFLTNDADINGRLSNLSDGIYIFGHHHVQWNFRSGNKLFINPGSCGLPLDGIKDAPYSVLEITNNGWNLEERRVRYDVDALADDLKKSELYAEANIWSEIILRELMTSFEHVRVFLTYAEIYANKKNDKIRPFTRETWAEAYNEWR